jgi:hypothetical protein
MMDTDNQQESEWSMKGFLEYLKTGTLFSFLASPPYFIRYCPPPVDGFVLSSRDGILTRDDIEVLCNELLKTVREKEELIKQANQEIEKIQQRQQGISSKVDKPESHGFIYLIKSETGHYKIGYSRKLFDRIKTFEVKLPFKVELIHQFPTDDVKQAESELHRYFAASRVNGEWFDLTIEQVQEITRLVRYQDGDFVTA